MRFYLDTEFNGFGGALISMALVGVNGDEFYEVKCIPSEIDPWVAENVIPVLNCDTAGPALFRKLFRAFLDGYTGSPIEIVADWPSDLEHFFRELRGIEHADTLILPVTAHLLPLAYSSAIPHNALEDARALRLAGL